ncbi:MAG: glycerophosphodiester phosphodiesterase [Ilumatobacteraceae bacterium]
MGTMAAHPFLDTSLPIAFAHRGGASDEPENTMPAFQRAVDLGYRYMETDVHATKDGVLLAFHDDDLQRTCGVAGRISELNYDEVQRARVAGREPIPLMSELLSSWPTARFNIDCKADNGLEPLIKLLTTTASLDRVCIGSFSDDRLRHLRAHFGKALCTSLGPKEVARLRLRSWLRRRPHFDGAYAAQIPLKQGPITITDRALVNAAHTAGLQVHVWTIDEPIEMEHLLDIGVDGIMTDRPAVLRGVLESRGLWSNL